MKLQRRQFLLFGGACASLPWRISGDARAWAAAPDGSPEGGARWIWFPGQLAAHRHARRMHRAMRRCTNVGYPANFRQPLTQTWFRTPGTVSRDTTLRWAGPIGRIRVSIGGRGGDITRRSRTVRAGQSGLEVQIDFAEGLPCLLLDGAELSTGPRWEASLDGVRWTPVEVGDHGDASRPPDAERELTVSVPVQRTLEPGGPPQETYAIAPGRDLLLDFGETELGVLRLDASGAGELTIQVGESVPEVRDPDPAFFEQRALTPVPVTGVATSIALPERVVRFARLSASGPTEVARVRFDASVWPSAERGRFESSDRDLNAIWRAAVATLRSNMHDFYLDGIRRDGLVWHDGPLTLEAYERVFFEADLSRQTLIAETMPANPSVSDLGIIDAPMYTVIGFERELMARGDPAFSRLFKDRIDDIMGLYASLQDERGFVDARRVEPYGYFPDWSATEATGPDSHGVPAYGQMLLCAAFAAAARLAEAWQDAGAAARWREAAARLKSSIRATFKQPGSGLYANGLDRNGRLDTRLTPFAQAFAIAFDIDEASDEARLFAFLDDAKSRPAHYSLSQVVELGAYARAGRAHSAIERLRSIWLPMIRGGHARFFEDIRPTEDPVAQLAMYGRRYGNSLCHAWAGAAPVMALSRGVLGVEAVEPGYRVCRVLPQRCGIEWVKGAVPTPRGDIEVEWRGERGFVTLPEAVSARLPGGRIADGPGRFEFPVP
jgi:hypothetical protein